LGAFLSGGLDSSAVVATMAQQSSQPVKTFSVGFSEDEFDESSYAREVAKKFGTDHHELILEPNALDVIDDIAWHLDEPFGDSSSIPTYMVSKMAAQEVTVVLSGDGGDEIFAGYEKYFVEERQRRYDGIRGLTGPLLSAMGNRLPLGAKGQRFLTHHALSGPERYFDSIGMFRDSEKRQLLYPEVYERMGTTPPWKREEQWLAEKNWLSGIQQLDMQTYLPLDILTKVDRMSMAHSIETRVPLLDHRVVEIAASMRPQDSMKKGVGKLMFKAAMRGILPDAIIDRPKQGFAVPLSSWFRGQLNTMLRDMLLSTRAKERGIFRPEGIEMLLKMHEGGRNMDRELWALLSFEMWAQTFLDRKSVIRPTSSVEIQSR
jgi:asparagine synthase (glutamine-hydrolysing)